MTLTPTDELIHDEVVIQHHKANHSELWQVDLELEALVEDGVVPVLVDRPGATLRAVSWDAMNLHIHVGVHHITFDP